MRATYDAPCVLPMTQSACYLEHPMHRAERILHFERIAPYAPGGIGVVLRLLCQ